MPEKLFVSLSGGADSLALLLSVLKSGKSCTAVHFEHGIRGQESLDDAAFCKRFCKRHRVPLTVISLDVPHHRQPGEGDEAAARRLRLEAWKKLLADEPYATVLLGHHAGDAAETMLMRLIRGSNVSGIAALRKDRIVDGIRFRRPLLDMTKQEIVAYLRRNGIRKWCSDSTNSENTYLRNFIRNELLPGLVEHAPYAEGGLKRAAQALELDAVYIEREAEKAYRECGADTQKWSGLDPALMPRVLRLFLEDSGCKVIPGHAAVERLADALKTGSKRFRIPLDGGEFELNCSGGILKVKPVQVKADEQFEAEWDWKTQPRIEFKGGIFQASITSAADLDKADLKDGSARFDAEQLPCPLRLSSWKEGDTILSFDGKRKNLKKLFCDRHISGEERSAIPVLRTAEGEI